MQTKSEAIAQLNQLGAQGTPFSFYCDFLGSRWKIKPEGITPEENEFKLQISSSQKALGVEKVPLTKSPISYAAFRPSFDQVVREINIGNSFLTNLTFRTPIQTHLTLLEIFDRSIAKYKLLVPDEFVVFSPETFVKIKKNTISSYPMKGTIDASVPNARELILSDEKEKAEHVTIVDLIRNDLSQVAKKVEVAKFRFVDELETNNKRLLQISSEIKGQLEAGWQKNLGHILSSLLPAGSISGAPKPETLRIIDKVENYKREFYTGICGHFNGESLDTGVMIRFIKKENDQLFYCSGGGITSFSDAEKEYQEMVDKIYLAI